MTIELEGEALPSEKVPDLGQSGVEPIEGAGATPVELRLSAWNDDTGALRMGVNGHAYPDAELIRATVGETQRWTVVNEMEWDHPSHLHGFFFQRADASGAPIEPVEWLDTINVPRSASEHFLIRYDNRPGLWMAHCHILDHSDAGMMTMVDLAR